MVWQDFCLHHPKIKKENTDKIKERNILQVYLNKDDALMCGNDYIGVDQLRQKAKEFIANVNNAENMPEKTQKNVDFFRYNYC